VVEEEQNRKNKNKKKGGNEREVGNGGLDQGSGGSWCCAVLSQ
jgi:hypothetical protein